MTEAGDRSRILPSFGHALFALYLLALAAISITFGAWLAGMNSQYVIGEWLINYSAGFVRRGLLGELILITGHATHLPLAWLVFALQVATYLLFLACVYRITRGLRWTFLTAAIVVSPATFPFLILSPWSGYRKEILIFAALSLTICALLSNRLSDRHLSLLLSAFGVTLVLSHEASIVCAPYFFAAVAIEKQSAGRAARILALPALLSGLALLAVFLHPGDLAVARTICASVGSTLEPFGPPDSNVCSGSITWLQFSLHQSRQLIAPILQANHFLSKFGWLAVLTFTPFAAFLLLRYRRDGLRREVLTIAWCTLPALLGMGLLCYSALDWGRWLHMQAMCLTLLVLLIDRRLPPAVQSNRHPMLRIPAVLLVILYATSWWLPAIGLDPGRETYLDVARNMRFYTHFHQGPPVP